MERTLSQPTPPMASPSRRKWRWVAVGAAVVALSAFALVQLPAPVDPVRIQNTIEIGRSPASVYEFVTTPGNWPKWHPSSLGVSGATDHSLAVGEHVTEDYLVAGRRGRAVWTVVERDAPRKWRIGGKGEGGGAAWITYTLSATSTGTRFEREMLYRMPNRLAALLDPLVSRARIREESDTALRQLRQMLEAG